MKSWGVAQRLESTGRDAGDQRNSRPLAPAFPALASDSAKQMRVLRKALRRLKANALRDVETYIKLIADSSSLSTSQKIAESSDALLWRDTIRMFWTDRYNAKRRVKR